MGPLFGKCLILFQKFCQQNARFSKNICDYLPQKTMAAWFQKTVANINTYLFEAFNKHLCTFNNINFYFDKDLRKFDSSRVFLNKILYTNVTLRNSQGESLKRLVRICYVLKHLSLFIISIHSDFYVNYNFVLKNLSDDIFSLCV